MPSGANPGSGDPGGPREPIVRAVSRLAGDASALEGARTFWHGHMDPSPWSWPEPFRLGGDLDAAYAFGVEAILAGVSVRATRASP